MKRQKSILIFDDEPMIGEILLEILADIYEEVVFVATAEEAKNIVQNKIFSLIISDVNMPELPGPHFVRFVRSLGQLNPIMFLTGYSSKEIALSALRLGVANVIDKPFDTKYLLDVINNIFEIEKRKNKFYEDQFKDDISVVDLKRQKKMLGLLHVVNDKKAK